MLENDFDVFVFSCTTLSKTCVLFWGCEKKFAARLKFRPSLPGLSELLTRIPIFLSTDSGALFLCHFLSSWFQYLGPASTLREFGSKREYRAHTLRT
jgi:hypothetical protein